MTTDRINPNAKMANAGGRLRTVDDPAQVLHRRYVTSLGILTLLLILNQVVVHPQFLALAIDPPTINRAGRQRMLSQKLAKAALAVVGAASGDERHKYLGELEEAHAEWTLAHEQLRGIVDDPSSPPWDSRAIRAELLALEPHFARLKEAMARLVHSYTEGRDGGVEGRAALVEILAQEGPYLSTMDRVVGFFEAQARSRIDGLLWTGRVVTALAIALTLALGMLALRPATEIIRSQLAELQRTRDELEEKVRERTQALEKANRDLVEEAERRSVAEARHRAALEMASHTSRTSTLGEMASGLAHELNQPLGAIANYAEGCLVELERDAPDLSEARAALRKILASTLRAGEVIKRVRRFVTRRGPDHEAFDAARAVEEVSELVADDARRREIRVRTDVVSDLPLVWGDPVQIQQVLLNLVRNACEAIIESETTTRTLVMGVSPFNETLLEFRVTDDGEGIAADHLGHVFDPYFSTRADGMGMGLAICRSIVEAHQGTLTVESEPGVGTTFRFTLPTFPSGEDDGRHGLRR